MPVHPTGAVFARMKEAKSGVMKRQEELLREHYDLSASGTRLIALHGFRHEPDIAIALEARFDGHLVTPVDSEQLHASMDGQNAGDA